MANSHGYGLFFLVLVMNMEVNSMYQTCNIALRGSNRIAYCKAKNLTKIPQYLNHDVHTLYLEQNFLYKVSEMSFRLYGELQYLHLNHSRIREIEQEAFFGLRSLVTLNLASNELETVPYDIFHDLQSLQHLYLSDNPIMRLEDHSFPGLPLLETLSLERCQIQVIEPRAFIGLDRLKTLMLSHNRLKSLHPVTERTLRTHHSLHVFYIHGNPWDCDCNIRWLKKWLYKRRDSLIYQKGLHVLTCATPSRLEDRELVKVNEGWFACRPNVVTERREYLVTSGLNFTINCHVTADPTDTIRWYRNGRLLSEEVDNGEEKFKRTNFSIHHIIPRVSQNETGEYMCEVKNNGGVSYASLRIVLEEPTTSAMMQLSTGTMIGTIVGGITFLLGLILITICGVVRRHRRRKLQLNTQVPTAHHSSGSSGMMYAAEKMVLEDPFGFLRYPEEEDKQTINIASDWIRAPGVPPHGRRSPGCRSLHRGTTTPPFRTLGGGSQSPLGSIQVVGTAYRPDPRRSAHTLAHSQHSWRHQHDYDSNAASYHWNTSMTSGRSNHTNITRSTFVPEKVYASCRPEPRPAHAAQYESRALRPVEPYYHIYERAPGPGIEDDYNYGTASMV